MAQAVTYRTHGFFGRIPLAPHQLTERRTPTRDCIVLCHLGVLDISAADDWELEIAGLVGRPTVMSVGQLKTLPKVEVTSVHQCAGSPLAPDKPTQRICNVSWAGARLAHIIDAVGLKDSARFVWSHGADSGEFGGLACGHYVKDLPLWRAAEDVLLAYEMNGAALLPEHGFPLRLVVPGFYGTNSVKWLRKLEFCADRAPGPFTTKWYNDRDSDGSIRLVWQIAPQSVIVYPKPDTPLTAGATLEVWGWAWSDTGLAAVQLSSDEGHSWQTCQLETSSGRSWTKFVCDWSVEAGCTGLITRAISLSGDSQPAEGRRNATYRVPVSVA